ncbi:MAG TPA: peptide chain release factor N(5)-glutamine methyltransferase [Pseudolabrys sp.]|jgi:release factor glutamine methyltransferase|nr:peptide chain release factor N(5)-glutamine methyltransferase [Pseudolabrys sp.]
MPGLKSGASVSEALQHLAQSFRASGIEEAEADARLLIGHALHLDRARLIAQSDRILEAREVTVISALAARRLRREPVSRILGEKEFWSLPISVTPDVLVPRPETETVVEAALDFVIRSGLRLEKLRVLDIGTGSGALLLALLKELPNAVGTGTDVSSAALDVARANATRCRLDIRCNFVICNIATGVEGPFDLIVSNPPYIAHDEIATLAPEVRDYDPQVALDGGQDGFDAYRSIASDIKRILAPGGRLFVELGRGQDEQVRALFTKAGLSPGIPRKDLAGITRVLGAGFAP